MNTAEKYSFNLETIPSEIWASIVCFLSAEHLRRLKMTGSTYVWQRLRTRGVVKSVNLGKEFLYFNSWPAFLNEFPSMEELSIMNFNEDWWSNLGLRMQSLPSTLRKLRIFGKPSDSELFEKTDGSPLHLDEHMPNLEALDIARIHLSDWTWLSRAPPTLTRLCLVLWDGVVPFPPTLVHLDLYTMETPAQSACLPPSLETFILSQSFDRDLVDHLLPILPPSVKCLQIPGEWSRPLDALDGFPKFLTSLRELAVSTVDLMSSPEIISYLPQTLTDLEISTVLGHPNWSHLPSALRRLSFASSEVYCTIPSNNTIIDPITGNRHTIPTYPLELLPRSITELNLYAEDYTYLDVPPDANFPIFPPKLTTLRMAHFQLSPTTASHLPSSLTHLTTRLLSEHECKHLPRGLITLEAGPTWMSPNLIKFLPRALRSLTMSKVVTGTVYFNKYGEKLTSISKHPDFIVHKNYELNIDSTGDSSLPSSLTSLELRLFLELGDSFGNQYLPNLRKLELSHTQEITDLYIPHLGRDLAHLDLASTAKVTGKSFCDLPRSLTYLNLKSTVSIDDSDIQHLPRTLETIDLSSAVNLTNACIVDFPRWLESLHIMYNGNITQSCFDDLPILIKNRSHFVITFDTYTWYVVAGKIEVKTQHL